MLYVLASRTLPLLLHIPDLSQRTHKQRVVPAYIIMPPPTGHRSNLKDLIKKNKNKKAFNRECSYLEDSSSCLALANQT